MKQLAEQLALWERPLSVEQQAQFEIYLSLLLEWNSKLNLTAIRQPEEIEVRHFMDALSCCLVTGDLNGQALIDVGTGAGFPGLPLKILFPQLSLTLVDSVTKKTRFLEAVVAELGLSEVSIVAERAETLGQDPHYREQFDWVLARAVARLPTLVEYLLPLCRVGGYVLAQKGESALVEIEAARRAIALLGGGETYHQVVMLGSREIPHYLVCVEKKRKTKATYPRRIGVAKKEPLG